MLLAILTALQAAIPAWAWGRLGHRGISRMAEQRLTATARAATAALLEEGESLADASTWADEYPKHHKGTGPWHYVPYYVRCDQFQRRRLKRSGTVNLAHVERPSALTQAHGIPMLESPPADPTKHSGANSVPP